MHALPPHEGGGEDPQLARPERVGDFQLAQPTQPFLAPAQTTSTRSGGRPEVFSETQNTACPDPRVLLKPVGLSDPSKTWKFLLNSDIAQLVAVSPRTAGFVLFCQLEESERINSAMLVASNEHRCSHVLTESKFFHHLYYSVYGAVRNANKLCADLVQ